MKESVMKTFGKIEIFAVIFVLTLGAFYLFFKDGGLVAMASSKSQEDYGKILQGALEKDLDKWNSQEIDTWYWNKAELAKNENQAQDRFKVDVKKNGVELFGHTVDNPVLWSGKLKMTPNHRSTRGFLSTITHLLTSIDDPVSQKPVLVMIAEPDNLKAGDTMNVYRHEKGGLYALVAPGV